MVRTKTKFVKSLNKTYKYIKEAGKETKITLKQVTGLSHHSTPLTVDNDFLDFRNYIGQKSWEF